MKPDSFDVAEVTIMPTETFTTNSATPKRLGTWLLVIRCRSKTSKINRYTCFCPMLVVAWMTPGTDNLRISDAAQRS